MTLDFMVHAEWILPTTGTIGPKSQNLFNNTPVIKSQGLFVPKSLVIPFEYLEQVSDTTDFALTQIDKYFPEWKRMMIRSSASEEDQNFRFPGQFVSDHIWHGDRDYAGMFIGNVLASYEKPAAKHRRRVQGIARGGLSLLIQESVGNSESGFDANFSGSFNQVGENYLLTFTNPIKGLNAMNEPILGKVWLDKSGSYLEGDFSEYSEQGLILSRLDQRLPIMTNQTWEIEFMETERGITVVQTTPVAKKLEVKKPSVVENVFTTIDACGSGSASPEGILYVPTNFSFDELIKFDLGHTNYCLATSHSNISTTNTAEEHILNYVANPTVIVDLVQRYLGEGHDLDAHTAQFMRQNRLGLGGLFEGELAKVLLTDDKYFKQDSKSKRGLLYSPTQLYVEANERNRTGLISPVGIIKDFQKV